MRSLEICGGGLTDAGVKNIKDLSSLTLLNLSQNNLLTDKTLELISGISQFRHLIYSCTVSFAWSLENNASTRIMSYNWHLWSIPKLLYEDRQWNLLLMIRMNPILAQVITRNDILSFCRLIGTISGFGWDEKVVSSLEEIYA